jgi:tetratricopeptide (TPR) repeat protein
VGTPASASPEIVSLVCLQVSQWAEARGAMATAMAFSQAAALTCPEDPGPALAAGMLALRWRRSARAETWLRRSIGLARRKGTWAHYAQAYVELGLLYTRRGEIRPAYRYYVQGLRAARRHGMIDLRGAALHGLLRLALARGDLEDAERFARAALRAYGRTNPKVTELLYDVAQLWVRKEEYGRAIPLLQRLAPTRVDPVERAQTLAMLAHAAAGTGDTRLYQESWIDAWTVINRRADAADRHLPTLLELARASALIRDWAHVEQATRLADHHANRHREPVLVAQFDEVAAALRSPREAED